MPTHSLALATSNWWGGGGKPLLLLTLMCNTAKHRYFCFALSVAGFQHCFKVLICCSYYLLWFYKQIQMDWGNEKRILLIRKHLKWWGILNNNRSLRVVGEKTVAFGVNLSKHEPSWLSASLTILSEYILPSHCHNNISKWSHTCHRYRTPHLAQMAVVWKRTHNICLLQRELFIDLASREQNKIDPKGWDLTRNSSLFFSSRNSVNI